MREILFRGKRVDNGEWVYGYYARKGNHPENYKYFILISNADNFDCRGLDYPFYFSEVEVVPESVGQYTGLTDKNSEKIFEGDVLEWDILWDVLEFGEPRREIVKWDYDLLGYRFVDWSSFCEVVGNIYDDPELLEVE